MQIFAIAVASAYAAYILLVRPLADKVELVYEVLGSVGQLALLVVIELTYSQKIVVPTEAILGIGFLLVGVKLAKQVRQLLTGCHTHVGGTKLLCAAGNGVRLQIRVLLVNRVMVCCQPVHAILIKWARYQHLYDYIHDLIDL